MYHNKMHHNNDSSSTQLPTFKALLLLALVCFAPGLMAANTPTVKWQFETAGAIWAPSTTSDGSTYVGSTDGYLYALDTGSGSLRWRYKTEGPIFGGVQVSGKFLYFTSDDGFLYKLDSRKGKLVWRSQLHNHPVVARILPGEIDCCTWDYRSSTPLVEGDRVFVGSADKHLYAIDIHKGKVEWSYATGAQVRSNPAGAGKLVIFASLDGKVTALQQDSGALVWQHETGQPIPSSPRVYQDRVIIGSRDAHLYALALKDGSPLWKKGYANGSWVESSAVVFDDKLYIGSSDWRVVLALNPADGSTLWETKSMDGGNLGAPAVSSSAVYQGIFGHDSTFMPDGGLVKLNRQTGALVWTFPMADIPDKIGHGVISAPEIVGDVLLFGGIDGKFYALGL